MPELPEVQTTVNGINKYAKGLRIKDVWTDYFSHLYDGKTHIKNKKFFAKFKKDAVGTKIINAERRAKNILIHLSNKKTVLIHMKMTGHLLYGKYRLKTVNSKLKTATWVPASKDKALNDPFNRFIHFVLSFSNGKHLALSDMRKFAKITIFPTEKLDTVDDLTQIGPEPLTPNFNVAALKKRLMTKPNGKIKTTLMDPSVVAGIGNIYSDEILWASGIHPLTKISDLKKKDFESIWKNTKKMLRKGIDFGGDSMSDYRNLEGKPGKFQLHHQAYRRTGEHCRKKGCKGIIKRIKVGGRSAHFCSVHQKLK